MLCQDSGKNMALMIRNDSVLIKCNEIWNKIKKILKIKFHSMLVYDEKQIKAKVRDFNGVTKTNFLGDEIPKENVHYTCLTCITIYSVAEIEKNIHKFI